MRPTDLLARARHRLEGNLAIERRIGAEEPSRAQAVAAVAEPPWHDRDIDPEKGRWCPPAAADKPGAGARIETQPVAALRVIGEPAAIVARVEIGDRRARGQSGGHRLLARTRRLTAASAACSKRCAAMRSSNTTRSACRRQSCRSSHSRRGKTTFSLSLILVGCVQHSCLPLREAGIAWRNTPGGL